MTINEAAEAAVVDPEVIQFEVASGNLTSLEIGGQVLIFQEDFFRWLYKEYDIGALGVAHPYAVIDRLDELGINSMAEERTRKYGFDYYGSADFPKEILRRRKASERRKGF